MSKRDVVLSRLATEYDRSKIVWQEKNEREGGGGDEEGGILI
jgi:hypothetical protein